MTDGTVQGGERQLGCCGTPFVGGPTLEPVPPAVIYVSSDNLPMDTLRSCGAVTVARAKPPVPHAGETLTIHEYTLSARITRTADPQIAETRTPVVPTPTE
jgi:hypothetical protein